MIPKKIIISELESPWKDTVKVSTNQHNLDLGEAQAIALTLQEKADYFLTDDLDARETAKLYNVKVHGTVGLILRAFREKIVDKKIAVEKIKDLQRESPLFITSDLVEEIIQEIENFKEK